MKVYLCGPITGTDDYKQRFLQAACHVNISGAGHAIINPTDRDMPEWSRAEWVHFDLWRMMEEKPDCILLMPRHDESAGCQIERLFAGILGIPCVDYFDFRGFEAQMEG